MVLLQDSKGDASGLLGGGGQSVFGATGASSFIVKATRTVAALFALGCIALAYLTSNQANSSGVFDRVQTPPPAINQPVETEANKDVNSGSPDIDKVDENTLRQGMTEDDTAPAPKKEVKSEKPVEKKAEQPKTETKTK